MIPYLPELGEERDTEEGVGKERKDKASRERRRKRFKYSQERGKGTERRMSLGDFGVTSIGRHVASPGVGSHLPHLGSPTLHAVWSKSFQPATQGPRRGSVFSWWSEQGWASCTWAVGRRGQRCWKLRRGLASPAPPHSHPRLLAQLAEPGLP